METSDYEVDYSYDGFDGLLKAKEMHKVSFHWVKGHDGHPQNERCDTLATTAADGSDLLDDCIETL